MPPPAPARRRDPPTTGVRVVLPEDQAELASRLLADHHDVHRVRALAIAAQLCSAGPSVAVLPVGWLGDPARLLLDFPAHRARTLVLGSSDPAAWLDAGADDHVPANVGASELLARVHCLLRRPFPPPRPARLTFADLSLDVAARGVRVSGRSMALSPQEFVLLQALVMRAPQPVRAPALLELLGGGPRDARDLKVIVYRLRRQLSAAGSAVTLTTHRGLGYSATTD